jgi:hypothetical protein
MNPCYRIGANSSCREPMVRNISKRCQISFHEFFGRKKYEVSFKREEEFIW